MHTRVLLLFALLSMSACIVAPPPPDSVRTAEIGEAPDLETAKRAALWVVEPALNDPSTAIFEYRTDVRRGYVKTIDRQTRFVWTLPIHITDRTKRGTYGNARIFEFYFLDDAMIGWSLNGNALKPSKGPSWRQSPEFVEPMPLAPFRDGGVPTAQPEAKRIPRQVE